MIDFEKYFKKSGDTKIIDAQYCQIIENESFVTYNVSEDAIEIVQAYGDGVKIEEFLCQVAKLRRVNKIRFHTRRNPKAFQRKYKYDIIGYILEKEVN